MQTVLGIVLILLAPTFVLFCATLINGKGSPSFIWYDLWVGAFWDAKKRWLYVAPLPCIVFLYKFPRKPEKIALGTPPQASNCISVSGVVTSRDPDNPMVITGFDLRSVSLNFGASLDHFSGDSDAKPELNQDAE